MLSSDPEVNQLFSNILWGQKGNFLDIPTDCPQRDERLGWTGDAQVFCKTACYQFDCRAFFKKWLRDMHAQWEELGYVAQFVPGGEKPMAAGWSDAAVLIPWQIFRTYGDKSVLEENVDMMKGHVDLIAKSGEEDTWRGGENLRQFGDWLATDSAEQDKSGDFVSTSHSGATNPDLLQSAFYALDTAIVAKTLAILGKDPSYYLALFEKIKARFGTDFPVLQTQTECAVALLFGLTDDAENTTATLLKLIEKNQNRMSTGFIGTPFLLHALSENQKTDVAWDLFLKREYPSWLYCVSLGATTMWEHWDGVDEKGEMWNAKMNSFNHYAYGAVADWVYEVAAGIGQETESAGFEKPVIAPHPTDRLEWLDVSLETKYGKIRSKWQNLPDKKTRYEITLPVKGAIVLCGERKEVEAGSHVFEI
jgi:alpha-L-rhamnosidase